MTTRTAEKYEFTGKSKMHGDVELLQIRLVRPLVKHGLKAGTIGGWIESAHCLSELGDCWVFREAMILNRSRVIGDVAIMGHSVIDDDSIVEGNGFIKDSYLRKSDIEGKTIEVSSSKLKDITRDWSDNHPFRVHDSDIENLEAVDSELFEVVSSTIRCIPVGELFINSSFKVTHSFLRIENGVFSAPTIVNKTSIMYLNDIVVRTPLTMDGVEFTGQTKIQTVLRHFPQLSSKQQTYIGKRVSTSNRYDGQKVLGDNLDLHLELARIEGEVSLKGSWEIINSDIRDFVKLQNHHESERSLIKDCSIQDLIELRVVNDKISLKNETLFGDAFISV